MRPGENKLVFGCLDLRFRTKVHKEGLITTTSNEWKAGRRRPVVQQIPASKYGTNHALRTHEFTSCYPDRGHDCTRAHACVHMSLREQRSDAELGLALEVHVAVWSLGSTSQARPSLGLDPPSLQMRLQWEEPSFLDMLRAMV